MPFTDPRGGALGTRPLFGPNSFIFMQFSAKKCEAIGYRTDLGSWRPLGNAESDTANTFYSLEYLPIMNISHVSDKQRRLH